MDNPAFVAPVAESVDAADSKSAAERCASSSLARGTKIGIEHLAQPKKLGFLLNGMHMFPI